MEKDVILKIENFSFQYNAQAEPTLHDINLTIKQGEKVLIAGPSGCGKSTLAHCINGLIPFSYQGEMKGSFRLWDKETKDMSIFEISKRVGTVLQDSDSQFIGLTVAEDIAFALENDCCSVKELHENVMLAAKLTGISDYLSHAPNELSGGQKQRVSLAGVMVDNVDLLLFDEPLANLDPATGKQTIQLIDEIHKKTGAAVLIIEHRLEDVLYRDVDRIVLMSEGKIVADMTPSELLSRQLLAEHGIREPLYLPALRYSKVKVTPEMKPENIHTLSLSENQKGLVRQWFHEVAVTEKRYDAPEILKVSDLSFSYSNGFQALNHISLTVKRGELLAIVGTNGAGKSTFSKVICGFEQQKSGTILFQGEDFTKLSIKERADHIGYVMQNPNQMISKVLIFDEVAFGLRKRGVAEEEVTKRVEETLKICGLWPFRKWPVSALSFGQKKRMTIASILVLNPEVIILDEPTAGQDYHHYTEIMEFLLTLNQKGITVIMITHDMHLMLEYARRTVVFSKGKIIADSTGADILTNEEIIKEASLKETSLYDLAKICSVTDSRAFVQHFIDYEREVRKND